MIIIQQFDKTTFFLFFLHPTHVLSYINELQMQVWHNFDFVLITNFDYVLTAEVKKPFP